MSAAVGRLSTEERDALILSALSPDDDCAHNMVPLYAAVEQIVARHLAAFKAEAVAAIEAEAYSWQSAAHIARNLNTT